MSFRNNYNCIDYGTMVYTCDHCELVFSDRTELLLLHMETFNDEQSGAKDCDNKSTNSTEFSRHIQCPSGQKSFQCNECDKNFSNDSYLKNINWHTQGQRFISASIVRFCLLIIVVLLTIW